MEIWLCRFLVGYLTLMILTLGYWRYLSDENFEILEFLINSFIVVMFILIILGIILLNIAVWSKPL